MTDFLAVMLARFGPALAEQLAPVVEELRAEYGGERVYIASPRAQRNQQIRAALHRESVAQVARRYRVSRRTVQRLQHTED